MHLFSMIMLLMMQVPALFSRFKIFCNTTLRSSAGKIMPVLLAYGLDKLSLVV
jgi:hypothetical protein